jgi:glycosyltransferase involved in cell wall biosynthesis
VLYIVTASRGAMGGEIARAIKKLEDEAGAEVIKLYRGQGPRGVFVSRLQTVRQSMTPRLLTLRNCWDEEDTVLVVSWYLLPILVLIAMRVLRRPRRLVSLGTFMHNSSLRRVVNQLLRWFRIEGLEFIALSNAERANLVEEVGIAPERVHRVVYRVRWSEGAASDGHGGYVFTGGCTNRDFATLFAAVAPLPCAVVAVASPFNDVRDPPPNVDLRIAIPEAEFEDLVARCSLLVLPLRAAGEACGQTVLLSGIRHDRPVIASRHESLIDYLQPDYPGFVPPHDVDALRGAIVRALSDRRFRESLVARVQASAQMLEAMGGLEQDLFRILAPGGAAGRHAAGVS